MEEGSNGLSEEGRVRNSPELRVKREQEEGKWVQVRNFLMARTGQVSVPVAATGMTQVGP